MKNADYVMVLLWFWFYSGSGAAAHQIRIRIHFSSLCKTPNQIKKKTTLEGRANKSIIINQYMNIRNTQKQHVTFDLQPGGNPNPAAEPDPADVKVSGAPCWTVS